MWQKLLDLDRRWIYLFVGISAIVPVLFPLGLKIGKSSSVTALYDRVESLAPGERVLISFDYGPSTGPENDPMADTLIRHCLARDLRVVVIALFPIGGPQRPPRSSIARWGEWIRRPSPSATGRARRTAWTRSISGTRTARPR